MSGGGGKLVMGVVKFCFFNFFRKKPGHGLNTPGLKNLGPPTPPLLLPWNCSAYSFAIFFVFFFFRNRDGWRK